MTPLERYVDFMESVARFDLTSLEEFIAQDVHFVDPFNDTHGLEHYRRIIKDMVAQLDGLAIDVLESAMVSPNRALIRWRLSGRLSAFKDRPWEVTGCSSVAFDDDGKVNEHLDYWDSAGQLYEKFPLVGSLMRYLRHKLSVE
ncbi:MAG: nuclear transport factor 2 family protein [Pseudomonadota bacterium]